MKACFKMTVPVFTQLYFLITYKENFPSYVDTQSSKMELAWFWKTVLLEISESISEFSKVENLDNLAEHSQVTFQCEIEALLKMLYALWSLMKPYVCLMYA